MNEISRDLLPFLDKNGRLISLPAKHKKKLLALWYLSGNVEAGREYSEPEINDLLDEWTLFHDPATLRREALQQAFARPHHGLPPLLEGGGHPGAGSVHPEVRLRRAAQ